MSVEVSYNKQFLLGLIFIIIILIVIEIGIKTYEFIFPSCEFIDADVFAEVDFGIKRSICLDSVETTIQFLSCLETMPDIKGWFELSPP